MKTRVNKYEKYYREARDVCGAPFPAFVFFFDAYERTNADVLDLGCGQGRDALLAARHGHRVLGVDVSETGVAQMVEAARAEGLEVHGFVADIAHWEAEESFDVVILDRVLHLLADDAERRRVLERSCQYTRPSGFVLIAETPKQQALLHAFFQARHSAWEVVLQRKGFVFVRRMEEESS